MEQEKEVTGRGEKTIITLGHPSSDLSLYIYMTAVLPLKDESSNAADTFFSDTSFILKLVNSLKVTSYLLQF